MFYAIIAVGSLAIVACAHASAAPLVLAQAEGGGIGGSLVAPRASPPRVEPRPGQGAAPRGAPTSRTVARQPAVPGAAIYSFPINTQPDGWAALKAEPRGDAPRLTKVYDGTLFLVVGQVPGWKRVQFKSGERGWIVERLVGCCRPASH